MARWDGRNFRLDGKAVFIAGAGGVGSAIARGVSEVGAKVVLADLDLAAAEKVARTIQKKKRPCRASRLPGFGCFQFYYRPYDPRRWWLAECLGVGPEDF